jgi:hypothetical protein
MVTKSRLRVPFAVVICLLASSAWAGSGPSETAGAASPQEAEGIECESWGASCGFNNLCCPGTTCMTVPAYGNQLACCHSISSQTGSCN